ncbi:MULTISPECIES: DUF5625 family protein [Xenorhabdus]|uniref:DUF5625 family protein n=1 Tax=Xenorhabdus TaxID=626 RepID=UPI0006464B3E|nr:MULTISPECIES: DUF5625 family protein [Xenorhabdus]MBC8946860.1 hypothetical protein [Xenorhabdus indica]MDC9606445.1 DUF5625 family protein [Xenorhabdus griffiniae]
MKVLPRHWGYLLIFLVCGWLILFFLGFTGLVRCNGFVSGLSGCHQYAEAIHKPIDVTKAGQSVTFDFEIPQEGGYQFALLFDKGNDYDEMLRRLRLFGSKFYGSIDDDGVITPVSLHLVKDEKIFFDEKINAGGNDGGLGFYYEEKSVNAAIRNIKSFSLPPGHYFAVITTLENVPAFDGIESFVLFTYYDPKI